MGVSDAAGRGLLRLPKNPGAASFLSVKVNGTLHTSEANFVTLDSVLGEQRALFLKVDVEGFEAKVSMRSLRIVLTRL